MYSAFGEGGSGHERAHDPCRADWEDVQAEYAGWSSQAALRITLATLTLTAAAGIIWGAFALFR